ncbi:flagellar export chaperone FlgN [Oceanirhabdus sp. W0125-5]|uniref:flagellar export chaperone FlgN n=1 Tax=Oceanirhabdus sp. W0125-5 TaxID=2999116 RepID=UPI0022F2B841|nr:flagellar export chaperone FlgN [Oceanirhabdus sp. W0125-5]WBW95473.1 flagellar export chaperone FlgN [Oceanirhabdus sp. W0125-5]
MRDKILEIMQKEHTALENLLNLLEEQHRFIASDSLLDMEECVKKIQNASKIVAEIEMERRGMLGETSMKVVVDKLQDSQISELYKEIRRLLEVLTMQKETNDLILKQKLSFTNQLLNALKPNSKRTNVYNSYGKVKR